MLVLSLRELILKDPERAACSQKQSPDATGEELTTPAAPGDYPGSTANGKARGGWIISRASQVTKSNSAVHRNDYLTRLFTMAYNKLFK